MSMGNPAAGYTQPYGSSSAANMYGGFGAGTYDPMLGFGQASGMGTTFNYPTRYSADYTRYAQSGQPFNQPVMGYNSYGQIFAQPQRPPPSFGKGGGGFRPQPPSFGGKGGGGFRPQPPAMGGKGGGGFQPGYGGFQPGYGGFQPGYGGFQPGYGYQPQFPGMVAGGPGFRELNRRRPERRTNQLGLNNPPPNNNDFVIRTADMQDSNLDGIDDRDQGPEQRSNQVGLINPTVNPSLPIGDPNRAYPSNQVSQYPVGPTPPPLTGGVPTDSVGGFGPGQLISQGRPPNPNDFQPLVQPGPTQVNNGPIMSYPGGSRNWQQQFEGRSSYYDGSGPAIEPAPVEANRQIIDENIYNSPFGQLIGQPAAQPTMAQQGANISNPDRDRAREINMRSMSNPLSITAEDMAFLQEYDARPSSQNAQAQLAAQQRQMAAGNTFGLGGMFAGRSQDPNLRVMGERNFDMQGFNLPPQSFNFGQDFGRLAFQEGGQVPPDVNMEMMMAETAQPEMAGEYDRLIQMTMQAILGQVESPDEVIQMFIDEFGVDAFRQLRDAVLKQQVPGAQTEGMVNGNGGGMDDQVMGMIGNQRPVAVSPGEYIVPADVVSGLGDGSSQAGADILDELNQAVRMTRTGTTQQPRPLMETLQQ